MIATYRRLLWDGRRWLGAAVLLFVAGGLLGYLVAAAQPELVQEQMRPLLRLLRGIGERVSTADSPVERTFIIFGNNVASVVRMMAGGIVMGIIPAFGSLANGMLLGVVAGLGSRLSPMAVSPALLLLSLAPHGVFELPALWLGAAWGMRLGLAWLLPSAQGRRARVLVACAKEAAQVLVPVVILLLIAAMVEGNVTLMLVRAATASPGIL